MFKTLLIALAFVANVSAYGHELFFVENKGQVVDQFYNTRSDIDLMLRSNGMSMYIGNASIHYQFRRPVRDSSFQPIKHRMGGSTEMYRLDVELVGANIVAPLITSEKQAYYEQYYMPQFGPEGMLANAYQKVTYKNIYPHIDWVFYIKDGNVEQDFIVNEGGDPAQIKLKFNGATSTKINSDGSFTASTPLGLINEKAPSCFDSQKRIIGSSYRLEGNVLSFNIDKYSGSITIDPTLVWERHDGSAGYDDVSGLDYDGQGNVYVTGENQGDNVATTGAFQGTYAGIKDGYIRKFTGTGNIVWGTFFGGPDEDQPFDAVCSNGNVYISGLTKSTTGIASPGSHQTTAVVGVIEGSDAFLAKFSSSGSRLWSTYYGGDRNEDWGDIACDNNDNIYMAGVTFSWSGIATPGSHQPSIGATNWIANGYLVKFGPDGIRQWGTYYGGDGGSYSDFVRGVACDASNNVYIVGNASSTNNIATPGSYQENYQGPDPGMNGLIAKFNGNGERIWGTYYHYKTEIQSITCDSQGNIFIAGNTRNTTDIATSGAFQTLHAGGDPGPDSDDCFISKLSSDGQRLWSTYLGGNKQEYTERIHSDELGHVYIVGNTASNTNFPVVNAYQTTYGGNIFDGFFAKFGNNGLCMWSSYLGGGYGDGIHDICIEDDHTFYIGSYFATIGNDNEAHLARFSDNSAGVKKLESTKTFIDIYPNPAAEMLKVKGISIGDELAITDVLGRCIRTYTISRSDIQDGLHIAELSPGIYFLSCKGETVKFIKQ